MDRLRAPFPWFGGKSRVADLVWRRFGDVQSYCEPFAGSLAVLLGRPNHQWETGRVETVNDLDGFVCNAWRSIAHDPDAVTHHADWPVNENDLHARHAWLVERRDTLTRMLEGDPDFHDAKIAGWWLWGMACWIGGGFCSGAGPWSVVDGQLVDLGDARQGAGRGVSRQLVHLGNAGRGVSRQRVDLGSAGRGVLRQRVHLGNAGRGVSRRRVHLGDAGHGVQRRLVHLGSSGQGVASAAGLRAWISALAERMRRVRVCSGDWSRVVTPSALASVYRPVGVLLDPPYSDESGRDAGIYSIDSGSVAHDVREWAISHEHDYRIALCGYAGEGHDGLTERGWSAVSWSASGGYGRDGSAALANRHREVVWFSPPCLAADQLALDFAGEKTQA